MTFETSITLGDYGNTTTVVIRTTADEVKWQGMSDEDYDALLSDLADEFVHSFSTRIYGTRG